MYESTLINEEYIYDNSIKDDLELTLSESDESSEINEINQLKKLDSKSRTAMINMRSNINKIKENVKSKFEKLEQIKDELKLCENHVLELNKEEQTTNAAIETNRNEENIAAVFRLQAQLKRIQIELDGEKDLRNHILEKINEAEQDYIKSQLEEGKYVLDEERLKIKEELYEKNVEATKEKRLKKEKKLTKNTLKSFEMNRKNILQTELEKQQISEDLSKSIKTAHKKHSKYLQKTLEMEKDSKYQLEKEIKDQNQKKELSIQKLNSEISLIKENLNAINAKRKSDLLIEKEKELELRKSVIQKGGNPNLEVKINKKQLEITKEKEHFLNSLKEKKLKIADKIVAEENNLKRKLNLMPQLFQDRLKPLNTISKNKMIETSLSKLTFQDDLKSAENQETWTMWKVRTGTGKSSIDDDLENEGLDEFRVNDIIDPENKPYQNTNKNTEDINIVTPEFEGLWDSKINYKVSKVNNYLPIKNKTASKMEQEIMTKVLHQLKENIIQPQIVNGKVFRGHSFQSKPSSIMFENLEVNCKYQQKVVLTNTSYSINQCRFENISENLLDFVTIKFIPPGPLSPGMTCEFTVNFEPKLDQDLFGEVIFTSQSEKFSIPIKCLTKKCKMEIDRQLIKYEITVIGETLIQSIKLKNSGAKGTFCTIKNKLELQNKQMENKTKQKISETNEDRIEDEYELKSITTSIDDLKLWIEPYAEQEVLIRWSPVYAGEYLENFVIQFEDEDNQDFDLVVIGRAIDVPVYIEDQTISMDICMLDRLYQDTVVFNSRAATALKLHFHVPSELKEYLEILPNSGFIQAGQSFKAQIKLLARSALLNGACPYFDVVTGVLDVPIKTSIANQVKTVDFNLQAILTTTDLEIVVPDSNESIIDFGPCTIKETKIRNVKLINKSLLAQEFGFTGYPDFIEIQPNFGYGTILPFETLEFQILFSPTKAENFQFQLQCQTLIDRTFTISCSGIGVHPALNLSQQVISFPHTAINDRSIIEVFLQNNHLSTNIYTHEPPKIGSGPVVPVGPQTFQFIIPDNSPISIHPQIGSLNPGEHRKITIFFEPKLEEKLIRIECSSIINKKLELNAKEKWEKEIAVLNEQHKEDQEEKDKVDPKSKKNERKSTKSANDKSKNIKSIEEIVANGPEPIEMVPPENIEIDSDNYLKGKLSLLQKFDFNFEIFKIKCIIAEGDIANRQNKLVYNLFNSLYLELHCPSVKPDLIILSNSGKSVIDFGENICKKKVNRTISIQNISNERFQIKSTFMNPNGVFQVCKAVRSLKPNEVISILVSFLSNEEGIFQSSWSLFGNDKNKILNLTFIAKAILPKLELKEVINGEFNSGAVLINEFSEKPLTISNNTSMNIDYRVELFSDFQHKSNNMIIKNKNALCIFNITPQRGVIAAGKSQTLTVSFSPDHISDNYFEYIKLFIFDDVEFTTFVLRGEGKNNTLYLKYNLLSAIKSLEYFGENWKSESGKSDEQNGDEKPTMDSPIILQSAYSDEGVFIEAKYSFLIGCVRTLAVSQKKNGEFSIDNINVLTQLGFSVEPSKGQIEADTEKSINISWSPPANYEIGSIISTPMLITLKGDTSLSQSVELRGFVL